MNSSSQDPSCSYPPPPLTASHLYVARKAMEILVTSDVTEATKLVTSLCYAKEKTNSSKLLYKSFAKHSPDLLAVKLLQVYSFTTTTPSVRSHSLSLLDSLLIDIEEEKIDLIPQALTDIKKLLTSCLLHQEISDHDFKVLSRVVSRISVHIFIDNHPWEDLCFFILSLQDNSKKTLSFFSELPTLLDEDFLMPLLENNLELKIEKGLFNQKCDDEEWCLALEAAFSLMLHMANLGRKSLVWSLVYAIMKSVLEMVNVRKKEIAVRKGLMKIAMKVRREAVRFREAEYEVVLRLALMIKSLKGVGKVTEMVTKVIHEVLDRYYEWDLTDVDLAFYCV